MFDLVEKVVYINMDTRKDRRAMIERELQMAFPSSKIQRMAALRHEGLYERTNGAIGCTKSHIAVLEMARVSRWANVLIVEDDLMWVNFEAGGKRFNELLHAPYDVIVLGGTFLRADVDTGRLYNSKTTTGYIVAAHYYDTLLANFKDGLRQLINAKTVRVFAIDVHWRQLQQKDLWYIVQPLFIKQRAGFSDIEKRVVNYNRYFMKNLIPQ